MKKSIILSVSVLIVVVALGVFWYVKNQKPTIIEKPLVKEKVDASNWQTYQNEEYGFAIKYPEDWHCGGTSLSPNNKKSIFCLQNIDKDSYYNRGEQVGGIMINVVDKKSVVNGKDDYGILTKTIERDRDNVQFIFSPNVNIENHENIFNSVADSFKNIN